jgi:rhodanese-related sulfurtransferase
VIIYYSRKPKNLNNSTQMKNLKYIYSIVILLVAVTFSSCSKEGNYSGEAVGRTVDFDSIIKNENVESLAEIYYKHGNFINTQEFPPIVKAPQVLENLNNWLIVDIRSKDAYESGHINGAYNVPKDEIIDFLTVKQKASVYEKVVIVCYSGQMASYVTGVLRFAAFDNVYVMLFGMAAWNSQFSEILKKGYGKRYPDMLVKSEEKKEEEGHKKEESTKTIEELEAQLPQLDKTIPTVLIMERARKLLKQSRKEFLLKADEFFPDYKKNEDKYYTVFYLNQQRFDEGHIKGAHLYKSRKDLSLDHKLADLPKDKDILVYCKTGHTGGNTTAYLNMLGYNAHNLMFGYNSFKYNVLSNGVDNYINDFPVVEGSKRTSNKVIAVTASKKNTTKVKIVKRKKKEVSGGCG